MWIFFSVNFSGFIVWYFLEFVWMGKKYICLIEMNVGLFINLQMVIS